MDKIARIIVAVGLLGLIVFQIIKGVFFNGVRMSVYASPAWHTVYSFLAWISLILTVYAAILLLKKNQ